MRAPKLDRSKYKSGTEGCARSNAEFHKWSTILAQVYMCKARTSAEWCKFSETGKCIPEGCLQASKAVNRRSGLESRPR